MLSQGAIGACLVVCYIQNIPLSRKDLSRSTDMFPYLKICKEHFILKPEIRRLRSVVRSTYEYENKYVFNVTVVLHVVSVDHQMQQYHIICCRCYGLLPSSEAFQNGSTDPTTEVGTK
jgi:hypothetical protein